MPTLWFIKIFTTGNTCENETPISRALCCPQRDVEARWRQELDSYVVKSSLLDRYILPIPKLVVIHCGGLDTNGPYATDDAFPHELWTYQGTVK